MSADLEAITHAADAVDSARSQLRLAVQNAHERGRSWEEIGDVFGISKQAAWERFHHEGEL